MNIIEVIFLELALSFYTSGPSHIICVRSYLWPRQAKGQVEQPASLPKSITLLRVIPILTHYSDIVSGISSGSVYGICILTSENLSGIYSGIHSCILSGIYSDSLSGILSGILSGLLSGHEFGSRRTPQHPRLATWLGFIHVHSPPETAEDGGGGGGGGGRRWRWRKWGRWRGRWRGRWARSYTFVKI